MPNNLLIWVAAASPVTSANTAASSGIVVRITTAATILPTELWGVTSPYPTVAAVTIAQ
jgi:hypothetical protein